MPSQQLIPWPKAGHPKNDCNSIRKPLFEVGSKVCAAWWPNAKKKSKNPKFYDGVVKNYTIVKNKDCGYGSPILYDILFDDETISCGIECAFVYLKEDFKRMDKKWKGVKNVYDKKSKDPWAKEVGWFVVTFADGVERPFSRLTEAIRAYDREVVRQNGPKTYANDLNIPQEWNWLPQIKSIQLEAEPTSSDSEDEADDENICSKDFVHKSKPTSPAVRTKKKRRTLNDSVSVATKDLASGTRKKNGAAKTKAASPATEAAKREMCKGFKGVSFQKTCSNFMAYVTLDKMRFLGAYKLASDAAFVVDKAKNEIKGADSKTKRNFAPVQAYYDARNREMEDTGLDLDTVGTVRSITSKAAGYIDKIVEDMSTTKTVVECETEQCEDDSDYKVDYTKTISPITHKMSKAPTSITRTKKRGKITSLQSVNSNTPTSITTETRSAAKETISPTTEVIKRKMSNTFNGVSFRSNDAKFMAYVTADKKRYLGCYELAADAAFAVDKVKEKIKTRESTRNFTTLDEYLDARNQEMKGTGLDLDAVGNVESLNSKIAGYFAKIIKELPSPQTNDNKQTSKRKRDAEENEKQPSSSTPTNSAADYIDLTGPSPPLKPFKGTFKGVSYSKGANRYHVYVNAKYAGSHHLATDAAYAYDEISEKTNGPGSRLHFSTVQDYYDAREEEMEDVGLGLDTVGTVEDVKLTISRYLPKESAKARTDARKCKRPLVTLTNQNV